MSDTVIRVENLGKKYIIGRNREAERYTALRDVIANGAKELVGRFKHPADFKSQRSASEEFWALKDVSFEIKQGDRVGIIGRNGAGKSTLLKILSRITEPTTGTIRTGGRVASLLEVGTGFHPELTGRENIFLNGAILGMKKIDITRKFDEIVDFAEVDRFLDTPVKRYSSGMYVRLAFAIAAHLEPEILIVDEVLAVGDTQFQRKCLGKMENVAEKEGRTVLFVSHNMAAISNLCNRGILFSRGEILAQGSSKEMIKEYLAERKGTSSECQWYRRQVSDSTDAILLSAKIISGGETSERVDISKEISIEIVYENLRHELGLYTSIHLKDTFGNNVLASVNFPSGTIQKDDYACRKLVKGKYRTRCVLPKNFLNNTTYTVSVLILKHDMSVILIHEDILRFTGVDIGEMSKEFSGHWIGSVRPKLLWKTAPLQ